MPTPREELIRKARFCLALGIAPSEYDAMTDEEIDAFIEVSNNTPAST